MGKLETDFQVAMFEIYRKAKEDAHYPATLFLKMLSDRGGLQTAKFLINSKRESAGYTALFERGRLDLTVEAVVAENAKWHPLFSTDEIAKARSRLSDYGYTPRVN